MCAATAQHAQEYSPLLEEGMQHLIVAVVQQPSPPCNHCQFLNEGALEGAGIGVFDSIAYQPQADCEVQSIFKAALAQMDDASAVQASVC